MLRLMPDTRSGLHILVVAPGRRPVETFERAIERLREDHRMPHEIHVVATRDRLAAVQHSFFAAPGRFGELCAAAGFARDEILFNGRTLHVVIEDGGPHESSGDADRTLALLKQLSSADDSSLTVVVAEDAGVAGHLLHAALQVVGRVADRLLIDLASDADRKRTRADAGVCRYLELPVLLWPAIEPVPATYADAVQRRRLEQARVRRPDVLRLDCRSRVASVGDTRVTLPALQFFWLWYLASTPGERFPLAELTSLTGGARRQPGQLTQRLADGRVRVFPGDLQRAFAQMFPSAVDKFDAMYQRACGPHPGLPSTISKINGTLRRALAGGAGPYLIKGGRGAGGYRITLPASAIQIVASDSKRG